MALKSSILFCRRFESVEAAGIPRASERASASWVAGSVAVSASWLRFFAAVSPEDGSTMGQTKPVRGVYAGLWVRRISRDFCRECRDASYVITGDKFDCSAQIKRHSRAC